MRWYASLRRSSEIAFVRRSGRGARGATLAVHAVPGPPGVRIAVTVAKPVGNAVVRNLVRRRIRGAFDALPSRPSCVRLVVVARPLAASAGYATLVAELEAALHRIAPPG